MSIIQQGDVCSAINPNAKHICTLSQNNNANNLKEFMSLLAMKTTAVSCCKLKEALEALKTGGTTAAFFLQNGKTLSLNGLKPINVKLKLEYDENDECPTTYSMTCEVSGLRQDDDCLTLPTIELCIKYCVTCSNCDLPCPEEERYKNPECHTLISLDSCPDEDTTEVSGSASFQYNGPPRYAIDSRACKTACVASGDDELDCKEIRYSTPNRYICEGGEWVEQYGVETSDTFCPGDVVSSSDLPIEEYEEIGCEPNPKEGCEGEDCESSEPTVGAPCYEDDTYTPSQEDSGCPKDSEEQSLGVVTGLTIKCYISVTYNEVKADDPCTVTTSITLPSNAGAC